MIDMLRLGIICAVAVFCAGASPRVRSPGERIIGGEDTEMSKYPYQIGLEYTELHMCGGSILTPTSILTAAHCTDGARESDLSIRAGSATIMQGGQVRNVSKIFVHPNYIGRRFDYDVSVLHLDAPLEFGPEVQPISLYERGGKVEEGSIAVATGWGATDNGHKPEILQVVNIPNVAQQACKEEYGSAAVTDRMICFGWKDGGHGTCQGDSGGPLVLDGKQVGIVSWAFGCALPNKPTVFARVPHTRIHDFITKNM